MQKRIIRCLGVICFLFIFIASVSAQENNQVDLTDQQQETYNNLQNSSGHVYVDWDDFDIVPDFLKVKDLDMQWQSDDYTEKAYQFLEEYKDLYKIKDLHEEEILVCPAYV